ncbi:MAG: recombinase family protein [Devosia sp.]|uniref:recombinase family protein n=1 Tax=Devosia sp. TaxID=1871048 RepID=UPI001AD01CF0|nr:recombinase family protein [Devosia sp.]MBN9315319.1 recombinase family protein [Devosia sp.]
MGEKKTFRCAVYTRKSSEEGLEQDFNSLEAQREACEAYVRSQEHEGWKLLPDRFDDGGFSGGNMERPALYQLIELVKAGRIDIIVVYKIDRLTRSLTDFAKLAEVLDKNSVSFVSVTQQFNTTTSMGRLMLNVLLSFAQFEREITGERIRDKIAASKKKGMWMGGVPPMGYDIVGRQLVVNEADAATIRRIFALYLEERSVPALLDRLERENIRTAARYSAKGNHYGNRPFTRGHLYKLLANPIYVGRVPHKSTSHRGQHAAIVDKATWDAVQALLADNTQGPRSRRRRAAPQTHLLEGLLHSESGSRFIPSAANKGSKRYRYYVEQPDADSSGTKQLPPTRLPATEIETAVVTGVQSVLADQRGLLHRLDADGATEAPVVMNAARSLLQALGGRIDADQQGKLRQILRRVIVGRNRIQLVFSVGSTRTILGVATPSGMWPTNDPDDGEFAVVVPFVAARRGRQMKLVLPGAGNGTTPNPSLVRAIVRAWDWAERLKTGEVASMAEICAAEGFTDTYVGQVLPLAFLSPELFEQILTGLQPAGLTANKLIWRERLPLSWDEQIAMLGAG